MKCVSSVSFTHESSSSCLQETAKAHLCDHRQTWHVLYSLSFSLTGVFEFLDSTFALQAFCQSLGPDLGVYGKGLSTAISFLQKVLTKEPSTVKEGWVFWGSAPVLSSP